MTVTISNSDVFPGNLKTSLQLGELITGEGRLKVAVQGVSSHAKIK